MYTTMATTAATPPTVMPVLPVQQPAQAPITPQKEICNYYAPTPLYALDWNRGAEPENAFRVAMGSLVEEPVNKLYVANLSASHLAESKPQIPDFYTVGEAAVDFPITKVMWQRYKAGISDGNLLATSTDRIKLWRCIGRGRDDIMDEDSGSGKDGAPHEVAVLATKSHGNGRCGAPLTSFDWNTVDPRILITGSVETTCSVWDVTTQKLRTQLIAHDREVYDVGFITGSLDTFASVGGDGSVRSFDLRSLEHCSILYEVRALVAPSSATTTAGSSPVTASGSQQQQQQQQQQPVPPVGLAGGGSVKSLTVPLMRLACHPTDPNYIATFALDAQVASILDVRVPSIPVFQLTSHKAPIQGITWSPTNRTQICTVGADSNVLIWDIQKSLLVRDQLQRQTTAATIAAANAREGGNGHHHHHHHRHMVQQLARQQNAYALQNRTLPVDPSLTYVARMPISSVAWSSNSASLDWIGITFGRTFQALRL